MLKKSLSMTITIATLLGVLWSTQGTTQGRKSEIACSQVINSRPNRDGILTTKWNNGRTYTENVFLTVDTNGVYLKWENSQDRFLIKTNGGSSRLCVIIFAYRIVKCLLGKTFRTILLKKLSV